jgi:hypothetical protein
MSSHHALCAGEPEALLTHMGATEAPPKRSPAARQRQVKAIGPRGRASALDATCDLPPATKRC